MPGESRCGRTGLARRSTSDPTLLVTPPMRCSHISSRPSCHSWFAPERGPRRVRVGQQRVDVLRPEQAALAGRRGGQRVAHPLEASGRPGGGSPAPGSSPSAGRSPRPARCPRRGLLEHALAALGELELRRAGRRQLDELVVEERHARLQPPGHRHVVDPLDRVVDQHDLRVEPQRRVQRGVGARAGRSAPRRTPGSGRRRAATRAAGCRPASACGRSKKTRGVRVDAPAPAARRRAAGTSRSRRGSRPRPGRTAPP